MERSGPLRLGDLAAAEGIAPSTLTWLVAVLEELGYVQRCADPKDARASTLAITQQGHDTLERLRAEGTALLTQSLMLLTRNSAPRWPWRSRRLSSSQPDGPARPLERRDAAVDPGAVGVRSRVAALAELS